MACPEVTIQTILGTECIGDSLPKINTNFSTLGDAACDLITKVNDLSSSVTSLFVVDSPTIDLSYNSTTGTLSADVKQDSIRYSHLASWQTLSGSPTLSAEAVQPRLAKAWILGTIGLNSISTKTIYAYNCSLAHVKAGVVRVLFHQPFLTENSFVFSWGTFDSGTTHHFITEAHGDDTGLAYTRQDDEIVLGAYVEGGVFDINTNVRINAVFFGV